MKRNRGGAAIPVSDQTKQAGGAAIPVSTQPQQEVVVLFLPQPQQEAELA